MGRQLASYDNTTYTYNESGIRTSKTVGEDTTEFYLNGTNVIYQTDGENDIYFFYDRNDEIVGFKYSNNNYFYVKNLMGDITDIADENGNIVASYSYDPWGKVTSVSGSNLVIANLNPFRYRSYYYDSDIQMYYLQSRYYDPEVGRFINCDDVNYIGLTELSWSCNPFSYCLNNPVNSWDFSGHFYVSLSTFGKIFAAMCLNPLGWIVMGVSIRWIKLKVAAQYLRFIQKTTWFLPSVVKWIFRAVALIVGGPITSQVIQALVDCVLQGKKGIYFTFKRTKRGVPYGFNIYAG